MHLKALHIKNFRALEDVRIEFDNKVNIIVGPNAIGKTTILEAIRLTKALLAPRTQQESQQALISIGAVAQHAPQQIFADAIARDPNKSVEISCRYELSKDELSVLESAIPQISTGLILSKMGQGFVNPSALTAYLSSPEGATALTSASNEISKKVEEIKANARSCNLNLKIDFSRSLIEGKDPIAGQLMAFLDQRNSPYQTSFSYFPADRALPYGEQGIQLGGADAATQLESHNSQPQLKYGRLKNSIFNAVVKSDEERKALVEDFKRIFEGILKGREFMGAGINQHGLLSIKVRDIESNRIFDIDGMSSGEKGLILTFLLIGRSVVDDGIILLDEPELHLNPAVCKSLLTFLVAHYAVRKNLQLIICSHSPEILAGAFENDECSLYHLMSEKELTKVRLRDHDLVTEALRKLGTSETEGLLYKATIFVEGYEDVELLEAGFGDLLRRHKLKDLGGRNEVEKQISLLQTAERNQERMDPRYFIFDLDTVPTGLTSSDNVKILQWDRRCLENYLIDVDVLTDLLTDSDIVKTPLANIAEVNTLLQSSALSQLDEFVARQVYENYKFEDSGLRGAEIQGKTVDEMANALVARLIVIKGQTQSVNEAAWKAKFIDDCAKKRSELEPSWQVKWMQLCDGKRLFKDIQSKVTPKMSLRRFKKLVMTEMRGVPPKPNWRTIESHLKNLIGSP